MKLTALVLLITSTADAFSVSHSSHPTTSTTILSALSPINSFPGGSQQSRSLFSQDVESPLPKVPTTTGGFLSGGHLTAPLLPVEQEMFPEWPDLELIQGGNTIKTYKLPPWAERCQVFFRTNGRPMKAKVELWLGPLRTTHKLEMDTEDGSQEFVMATLKFKKASQVLKITTTESVEFPVWAGVFVPPLARADELGKHTENMFDTALPEEKRIIQGGSIQANGKPGPGAYRYWTIPSDVESVQILAWSKETGKKSLKADIEVLQGPDCKKQSYFLQCGGGSQPYHGVFQTPGDSCVIGIRNKKFLEDGLTEFVVKPYKKTVYEY